MLREALVPFGAENAFTGILKEVVPVDVNV
jgi:hypothetical protein